MEMVEILIFLNLFLCFTSIPKVNGTGALIDPPARSVLWKYGFEVATNYDYMRLNCGGLDKIREQNGKCGVCGDPYDGSKDNELNGRFGTGIIGRYYPAETKDIRVKVDLTGYLQGYFEFRICAANNNPVTQECLNRNLLPIREGFVNGSPMRFYPPENGVYNLTIAIPPGFTCERCVLQWRYNTGNSWGVNPDGRQCIGCGIQEQFQNCADLRIGGSIPEPMKNNKQYKEMGWLDFKQQTSVFTSDEINTVQSNGSKIQTNHFGVLAMNSSSTNMVDTMIHQVTNTTGSIRASLFPSSIEPDLVGIIESISNDPKVVSSDSETINQLAGNTQSNMIIKTVNSVLGGETIEKKKQPEFPGRNLILMSKVDKQIETKQPITDNSRLNDLTNKTADISVNSNSIDVTVLKPVEKLNLKGSSGDFMWPFLNGETDRRFPLNLQINSLTAIASDRSDTSLPIVRGTESRNLSSKLTSVPNAIQSAKITERSQSITFDSKMPRRVLGLNSESLGPTNDMITLDLTKVSSFNTLFPHPKNTKPSLVKDPRTGLTIRAASRPSNSSAPLLPHIFEMLGGKHNSGKDILGLKESPPPPSNIELLRQSTSGRNIDNGPTHSALGSVQRSQNGTVIQPILASFEATQDSLSQQGDQGSLNVFFSKNDSSLVGVPSSIGVQRSINQISKTHVPRHNSENIHSSVPGGINSMLQNSGTRIGVQVPQNNLPSVNDIFNRDVGLGRNVRTSASVARGANRQSPTSNTQEMIHGSVVTPQIANLPIQPLQAPQINRSAPMFISSMPWSSSFNQVGATSAVDMGSTFAQASSQTGPGTGRISESPRMPIMLPLSALGSGLSEFPVPRVPLPFPFLNDPLFPRTDFFPRTQPIPFPITPLQPILARPEFAPRDLPLGTQFIGPLRPQPFALG